MTLTVIGSSLVMMKRRIMMEVLPQSLRDLWKKWELRGLVFLSLISQIVLIILGNRRKYNPKLWIKGVVWIAYLLADAVATMGLGVLLNNLGEVYEEHDCSLDPNNQITAFWAPFFLLHLGGPDTITAYSLEDNELYLRHAFGLGVQTFATIYIFLLAWSGSHLSYLSLPMILVGCIKYGERTWTLWSASSDQLRESLLTPPDAGPNYPKFMNEFSLKHSEGFCVVAEEVKEAQVEIVSEHGPDSTADTNNILKANNLFQIFKCLFSDLILSFLDRDASQSLFKKMSYEEAFNVIAIELGFMYDLLYTKSEVIHTYWGAVRRIITFSFTCLVLLIFSFADKNKYFKVELYITFLLLIIAICLEIYAASALILSDHASLWFHKHKTVKILKHMIDCFEPVVKLPRWSNSMGQYSLTRLCLEEKFSSLRVPKLLHMDKLWEEFLYKSDKQVPERLRRLIFKHVIERCDAFNSKDVDTNRGRRALEKYGKHEALDWSVKIEFDQSILVWHIATELCYYSSTQSLGKVLDNTNQKLSKIVSRYMLYLLVVRPSLLPVGIGLIRFRDTLSEAKKFFKERGSILLTKEFHSSDARNHRKERRIQASTMLLKVKTHVPPVKVKGDRSKSVLFDACRLASALNNEIPDAKKRWKMVRDVWFEILNFAASQGRGSQHARQLKGGGEFLTHVWLLIAHFGMTDQFQISQGHARAKLNVK